MARIKPRHPNYEGAIYWLKAAEHIAIIGVEPASGEPVHVTMIISGPPKEGEDGRD